MQHQSSIDIEAVIDAQPLSRIQLWVYALCGVIALLDGFDTQAIAFVAPLMAAEWAVPLAGFGAVFGAGLLGLCIGSLGIGPLADRYGRRPVIALSTLVFGAMAIATTCAGSLTELIVLRFITGLGLGGAMPNLIAIVAEYAPKRKRAFLITASYCGFPLGGAVGGLLAAMVVPVYGWQAIFWIGGALPLLCVPLVWAGLPESPRFLALKGERHAEIAAILMRICRGQEFAPGQRFHLRESGRTTEGRSSVGVLFADGRAVATVLLWAIFFCSLLIMYFLFSWLPSILQKSGMPMDMAIRAVVVLNLGGILGGLGIGRHVDRWGPFRILAIAYGCGALCVALIGLFNASTGLVLLLAFLCGMLIIGSQFAMNALTAGFYPTEVRSTGLGWALGVGRIGSVIGPLFGALLLESALPMEALMLVISGPAALSALLLLILRRRQVLAQRRAGSAVLANS